MKIEELERLIAEATPGPLTTKDVPAGIDLYAGDLLVGWVASLDGGANDAALLCAAYNALPALLTRIADLETARRTTREALGAVEAYNPGGIVVGIAIAVADKALEAR